MIMEKYNYDDMLNYVLSVLTKNNGIKSKNPILFFRNRFLHIKRVLGWVERLLPGVENINEEVVKIAAIFHDCGYGLSKDEHAHYGAKIFKEYALLNNFDNDLIEKVYYLIDNHSHKKLLFDPNTSIEMIVLLEADLLDEEGALGVVFDLLAEGTKKPDSYYTVFNEIMSHSAHILEQDFMVTKLAKKYWEEKKEFIRKFIEDLKFDLFME